MNSPADIWIQRATVAVMLALGALLVGMGLSYYANRGEAWSVQTPLSR